MANVVKYNSRVVMKHDTKAHWDLAVNFIPLAGEIIVYDDLKKIKVGDGVTKVNDLKFIGENEGNYVSYSQAQSLTDAQKLQARNNIDVYSKSEIDNYEFITVDDIDAICGTIIQVVDSTSEVTF